MSRRFKSTSSGPGRRRGRTARRRCTADCKGSTRAPHGAAAGRGDRTPPRPTLANPRRGKGEKANKKKMAAGWGRGVYHRAGRVRTADAC